MEVIALQTYTDKYVSLYEGEIRDIGKELAERLITKGVVAKHNNETFPSIEGTTDEGKILTVINGKWEKGEGSNSGSGFIIHCTTEYDDSIGSEVISTVDKTWDEIEQVYNNGLLANCMIDQQSYFLQKFIPAEDGGYAYFLHFFSNGASSSQIILQKDENSNEVYGYINQNVPIAPPYLPTDDSDGITYLLGLEQTGEDNYDYYWHPFPLPNFQQLLQDGKYVLKVSKYGSTTAFRWEKEYLQMTLSTSYMNNSGSYSSTKYNSIDIANFLELQPTNNPILPILIVYTQNNNAIVCDFMIIKHELETFAVFLDPLTYDEYQIDENGGVTYTPYNDNSNN